MNDGETAGVAAQEAKQSAENASEYASRALGNLSTVQSVSETLTWITQHGTMTLTSDQHLDPTHVYFVVDAGGDYVVGGVTYAIVAEPDEDDLSTYYELTIDESLNNYVGTHLALTSEGLWLIPEAGGNKVLIATGGVGHTYEDAGTYIIDENDNISAQFLEDGATIYGGTSGTLIAHLGYGQGYDEHGQLTPAPYYTLGIRAGAIGNYSTVEGWYGTASGSASHAEGSSSTASGRSSHTEGTATIASGYCSHAEGEGGTASGSASHAEGYYTTASATDAHAEGSQTTASDDYSHAEGVDTTASGYASHAQNNGTCADQNNQTAIGKYNTKNNINNLFAVGNGTSDNARSDAFTVDKDGNVMAKGKTTLGAINGDSLFAYTSVSVTTSSISANASGEVTSSASNLAGYYPLAIAEVNISTGVASLRRFYFSTQQTGKAVVKIGVQNDGTSAKTISATARILWVKVTA